MLKPKVVKLILEEMGITYNSPFSIDGETYPYRIKKDGSQGLARYCPACGGIIKSMGIKNVYYTLDEPGGWCYEKLGDE